MHTVALHLEEFRYDILYKIKTICVNIRLSLKTKVVALVCMDKYKTLTM